MTTKMDYKLKQTTKQTTDRENICNKYMPDKGMVLSRLKCSKIPSSSARKQTIRIWMANKHIKRCLITTLSMKRCRLKHFEETFFPMGMAII